MKHADVVWCLSLALVVAVAAQDEHAAPVAPQGVPGTWECSKRPPANVAPRDPHVAVVMESQFFSPTPFDVESKSGGRHSNDIVFRFLPSDSDPASRRVSFVPQLSKLFPDACRFEPVEASSFTPDDLSTLLSVSRRWGVRRSLLAGVDDDSDSDASDEVAASSRGRALHSATMRNDAVLLHVHSVNSDNDTSALLFPERVVCGPLLRPRASEIFAAAQHRFAKEAPLHVAGGDDTNKCVATDSTRAECESSTSVSWLGRGRRLKRIPDDLFPPTNAGLYPLPLYFAFDVYPATPSVGLFTWSGADLPSALKPLQSTHQQQHSGASLGDFDPSEIQEPERVADFDEWDIRRNGLRFTVHLSYDRFILSPSDERELDHMFGPSSQLSSPQHSDDTAATTALWRTKQAIADGFSFCWPSPCHRRIRNATHFHSSLEHFDNASESLSSKVANDHSSIIRAEHIVHLSASTAVVYVSPLDLYRSGFDILPTISVDKSSAFTGGESSQSSQQAGRGRGRNKYDDDALKTPTADSSASSRRELENDIHRLWFQLPLHRTVKGRAALFAAKSPARAVEEVDETSSGSPNGNEAPTATDRRSASHRFAREAVSPFARNFYASLRARVSRITMRPSPFPSPSQALTKPNDDGTLNMVAVTTPGVGLEIEEACFTDAGRFSQTPELSAMPGTGVPRVSHRCHNRQLAFNLVGESSRLGAQQQRGATRRALVSHDYVKFNDAEDVLRDAHPAFASLVSADAGLDDAGRVFSARHAHDVAFGADESSRAIDINAFLSWNNSDAFGFTAIVIPHPIVLQVPFASVSSVAERPPLDIVATTSGVNLSVTVPFGLYRSREPSQDIDVGPLILRVMPSPGRLVVLVHDETEDTVGAAGGEQRPGNTLEETACPDDDGDSGPTAPAMEGIASWLGALVGMETVARGGPSDNVPVTFAVAGETLLPPRDTSRGVLDERASLAAIWPDPRQQRTIRRYLAGAASPNVCDLRIRQVASRTTSVRDLLAIVTSLLGNKPEAPRDRRETSKLRVIDVLEHCVLQLDRPLARLPTVRYHTIAYDVGGHRNVASLVTVDHLNNSIHTSTTRTTSLSFQTPSFFSRIDVDGPNASPQCESARRAFVEAIAESEASTAKGCVAEGTVITVSGPTSICVVEGGFVVDESGDDRIQGETPRALFRIRLFADALMRNDDASAATSPSSWRTASGLPLLADGASTAWLEVLV